MTLAVAVPCKACHRPIHREPYRSRALGPVCGGTVKTARRHLAPRPDSDVDPQQLDLLDQLAEEVTG